MLDTRASCPSVLDNQWTPDKTVDQNLEATGRKKIHIATSWALKKPGGVNLVASGRTNIVHYWCHFVGILEKT